MNKHSMTLMSKSGPDDRNGSVQTPGRLRETEDPQARLSPACPLSSVVPCLCTGCRGRAGESEQSGDGLWVNTVPCEFWLSQHFQSVVP